MPARNWEFAKSVSGSCVLNDAILAVTAWIYLCGLIYRPGKVTGIGTHDNPRQRKSTHRLIVSVAKIERARVGVKERDRSISAGVASLDPVVEPPARRFEDTRFCVQVGRELNSLSAGGRFQDQTTDLDPSGASDGPSQLRNCSRP